MNPLSFFLVTVRNQVESVIYKSESGLRFGQKMKKVKEEQHNTESFDSSCQVKPSEIPTVQPCVIVQSAEEKSLYRTNRIYACPICGKVYSYLESFRNHQKLHINSKAQLSKFSCQKCKKTFSSSASLTIHARFNKRCVSEQPTNHRCDQCSRSFSSVRKFEAHQEMHKLRPHRCTVCAKCFVSSEGLKTHLLGHESKKYKCDICQKSFRVPAELRYHYNIHTGAKPYKCNLCHRAFAQLGNLITHRKTHLTVFKEGDDVPLRKNDTAFIGQNQVLVIKNDILETTNVVCQEGLHNFSSFKGKSSDQTKFSSELLKDEEREPSNEALEVENWECFECGAHFREEAELHMHYMKHARGEI